MFKDYKADFVVMKDSGIAGGTINKINACIKLGITPIVIQRLTEEKGIEDIDELLGVIM
jgi:precorrin-6A/cobalt-precorrin-6A reductase